MPSVALSEWQGTSAARLDELELVHASVRGQGPGRRWGTRQLNRSLFVILLAQFQTYCRGLHDEAVDVHIDASTSAQADLLRRLLSQDRSLDHGNPSVKTIGRDFRRLGIDLADALERAGASSALDDLETLVKFRNGIAHGNESDIEALVASRRIGANPQSYRRHRRSVATLVTTMDRVVANDLAAMLQIPRPW